MFINFRPMGVGLFHANEQRDMTELTVTFRNFAKASKNDYFRRHTFKMLTRKKDFFFLCIQFMGNSE